MSQWFVLRDEVESGPLSGTELLELVRCGEVTAQTRVRKGDSAWFAAVEVGGLFEAAAQSTVEFSCTLCGHATRKPPCYCRNCGTYLEYARPRVVEHKVPGYEAPPPAPSAANRSLSAPWKEWISRVRAQREGRRGG